MARIVQKYGGAALASVERIRAVAEQIKEAWQAGNQLVVVVSAMQGETNRLISLAKELTICPDQREYDVLVSSGEQVAVSLLAMTLKSMKVPAVSLLAHQVGIRTDSVHAQAKIQEIDSRKLSAVLDENKVAVVAGFQGMDSLNDLTTLGRGGTDLTAVAVASAINADQCYFYKDVDGVFTANPQICRDAVPIRKIGYEEMMEMASTGAKVCRLGRYCLPKIYACR